MCLIKIADYQGLQEVIPKNLFWILKGNSGSKSLSYHFNALNLKSEVVGLKDQIKMGFLISGSL